MAIKVRILCEIQASAIQTMSLHNMDPFPGSVPFTSHIRSRSPYFDLCPNKKRPVLHIQSPYFGPVEDMGLGFKVCASPGLYMYSGEVEASGDLDLRRSPVSCLDGTWGLSTLGGAIPKP